MESKFHGADKDDFYRLKVAEKKKRFDAIRKELIETNAPTYIGHDALKIIYEIALQQRKKENGGSSETPDRPDQSLNSDD